MSVRFTPQLLLSSAVAFSVLLVWITLGLATQHRWMGLTLTTRSPLPLAPDYEAVWIADVDGPASEAGMPQDQRQVLTIGMPEYHDNARSITLEPGDLIEEPDRLESYAERRAFFARQDEIAAVLRGFVDVDVALVEVEVEASQTHLPQRIRVESAMQRPVSSLPAAFWVQIAAGLAGFWIGVWIWALRRAEWATRFLAIAPFP